MPQELRFDNVWHILISVVLIAMVLLAAYIRFTDLATGVRSIFRPDPGDAIPAPLPPGRRVARVIFGLLAICCLAAATFMVWLAFEILLENEAKRAAAIIPFIVALLLVVLAKAAHRIGVEGFRWH